MSNSIVLAEQYLPIIDEIYKREALTSRLDMANERVRFIGGNAVELFKASVPGLGDYNRSTGFPTASYTSTWEKLTLSKDRGVSMSIDSQDDEETLGMAFGTLVGEFMRTQEVPEMDAYTFSRLASWSGVSSANADITVGTTDVPALIETAEMTMNDDEVPQEGRILYISAKAYSGLKSKITRYLANENGVNRMVETFDGMPVVVVPQARFNTAITLYDGSANFGFVPTSGGYKINFMIVHPSAVVKVVKHVVPRIWTPSENLNADAYKFDYRIYHDTFVLANKVKGIYVHRASTANS